MSTYKELKARFTADYAKGRAELETLGLDVDALIEQTTRDALDKRVITKERNGKYVDVYADDKLIGHIGLAPTEHGGAVGENIKGLGYIVPLDLDKKPLGGPARSTWFAEYEIVKATRPPIKEDE